MLYTPLEKEGLRRCRKNLLWSLLSLAAVCTVTWFFVVSAMFKGSSPAEMGEVMLNAFVLLGFAWTSIAVFRLARLMNPRFYFWFPIMLSLPLVPYLIIPFLLIKASNIIRRPEVAP